MKWSKNRKNDFPYSDMLGHWKHLYFGRILKKSLQGSFRSILRGNKGLIWLISVAFVYSECTATQKQVPHSQKGWHNN